VKTILPCVWKKRDGVVCPYNDVTLTDIELHGKDSTDCENSEHFIHHYLPLWPGNVCIYTPYIDKVMVLKARGCLNYGTPCSSERKACYTAVSETVIRQSLPSASMRRPARNIEVEHSVMLG